MNTSRLFSLCPSNGGKYTIRLSHLKDKFNLTVYEDKTEIHRILAPYFVNGLIFLAKRPLVGYDGYYSRRKPFEQSTEKSKRYHIHSVTRLLGRLITTNEGPVEDTIYP